jgi:uncharacterized protein YidB (DUF937 family)
VLLVATLWPAHWDTLTTRTDPDRHAQACDLLSGHNIDVPERFSPAALSKLAEEAGTDPRLAEAAARAADGQITQYLAGAPVLLDRYQQAPPGARALIWAAMDARRLRCGPHLPLALLETAAPGYLTDSEWDQLDDNWLEQALAYATRPGNGIPGPLTRIRPRNPGPHYAGDAAGTGHDGMSLYRLADYLDQYGRRHRHALIPPPSFWTAAPCAQPADLSTLAAASYIRGLYRAAAQLLKSSAARGDPRAGADLIAILHELYPGDHRPAQWVTVNVSLGDPTVVARLLDRLREAGTQDQVTALLARDPAAHVALDDPTGVDRLLGRLREAGAQDQVSALADRAAAHIPLDDPTGVARLLGSLRAAAAQDQVTALLARDPAAHIPLDDPTGVARLLGSLRAAGAQDQVTALLARDPAAHVALDDPSAVAVLLGSLRAAGAQDQVTALLARDPDPLAVASRLGRLHELAVASRLGSLREDQVSALADRAAAHVALDNPAGVADLLGNLRAAGTQDQVTALLARDPAAHVALDDPAGVADLLGRLRAAGAQDQVTALLARDPAAHVALDNPFGVAGILLGSLREAGAEEQVTLLVNRLPGEGLFDLFRAQGNHQALYRFGRNPDGSPAEPWDWEDLD